jgi:hypothetical protein
MTRIDKTNHGRATRTITAALTLGDAGSWHNAALVLAARLNAQERAMLGFACLRSLDEADRVQAASLACQANTAGPPGVAFGTIAEEAENWSALASEDELATYAFACLARMPRDDFKRFLRGAVQAIGKLQ